MKDWRGNEIKVGGRVLYPIQWGHSVEMVVAEVVKTPGRTITVRPLYRTNGERLNYTKNVSIKKLRNVTVVA